MSPIFLIRTYFRFWMGIMLGVIYFSASCSVAYAQVNNTPQTLYLIAGSVTDSGTGDGTGAKALFTFPTGIVKDASGNLYIADTVNNTIRMITPAGVVTTLAGTAQNQGSADGQGSSASFYNPTGMVMDAAGNLYVADSLNNTIRKITTPGGVVTTLAGTAGTTGTSDGTGAAAQFNNPTGMAIDSSGNLYVADSHNNSIRKINPTTRVVSTFAGTTGAAAGSANGTGTAAGFNTPTGLTIDSSGNLYVSDTNNETIRKITPQQQVSTLAGSVGTFGFNDATGSAALFNVPLGLAVDSTDNLYVADAGNNVIRKITSGAVVTTVAGTANLNDPPVTLGSLPGQLNYPVGVLVLNANQLAITVATSSDENAPTAASAVLGINFNTALTPSVAIQQIITYFNTGIANRGLVTEFPALKAEEIALFNFDLQQAEKVLGNKNVKPTDACPFLAVGYGLVGDLKNDVLEIIRGPEACTLQSQIKALSVQLNCPTLPSQLSC